MNDTEEMTRATTGLTGGCLVSNHRIGSTGTVMGDPFVSSSGETMIWVKYPEGIKPERMSDLIELGIFKAVWINDAQSQETKVR